MTKFKVVNSKKFKTNQIAFQFVFPLQEETAGKMAVLLNIMVDRCLKYSTKQMMSNHLDSLYGASLANNVVAYGKSQMLEISMNFLNDAYVENSILEDIVKFLAELIFHPLITEETVKEAKELHHNALLRNLENPTAYLRKKAFQTAGTNQPLSIYVNGREEEILNFSLEDMQEAYEILLQNSVTWLHLIGDVDETEVLAIFSRYFNATDCKGSPESYYHFLPEKVNEIVEDREFGQSYITLLYNHEIDILHKNYPALLLGNALFGQLPISFLFQEIREKRSLCYSIHSTLLAYDTMLSASAGIQAGTEEEVSRLVQEQLTTICKGDFSEELLDTAKEMLVNVFQSSFDYQSSIVGFEFQNSLLNRVRSIEDVIRGIQDVKKTAVIEVMSSLELNTIYTLKGAEHEEDYE